MDGDIGMCMYSIYCTLCHHGASQLRMHAVKDYPTVAAHADQQWL